MMRGILLGALSWMSLYGAGCSGDSETIEESSDVNKSEVLSLENIERTWVFKAADIQWRGQFEGDPGWTGLFNRDYASALSGASGVGDVRMQSEYAGVYRQATLMHAHATNHIYNTDRQEEDGPDTLYLRAVARTILGDYASASADFQSVASGSNEQLKGFATQWTTIASKEGWTPKRKVEGHFVNIPPMTDSAKDKFRPESIPHFSMATTLEGVSAEATDSTELWVRSRWHEQFAKEMAAQNNVDPRWVDVFMGPWLTPMEYTYAKEQAATVLKELKPETLNDGWLFLSRNLVAEDALFLYDLQFSSAPIETLKQWSKSSVLAEILEKCLVDGQLDVPKVLDAAGQVELAILEAMKKAQGKDEPFYPLFADFAEQAVLIAGVLVADKLEQREDSGRLRLNARDLALQNSKDALFLTSFAAWDVQNRYPLRAQDMLHKYSGDFPAFRVAGHPLGTLQIRLGRSAGVPGAAN